jgi:phage-related protein (TIGR01555 family)
MSPKYGDPETYLVANAVATSTYRSSDQTYRMKKRVSLPAGQNYASSGGYSILNVHESRIVRFDGIEPDVLTRQQLAGWSWSILQRAYEILRLCDMAFDSLAYLISDASQGVMKLKGVLKGLSVPGQRSVIEQRMKLIDESRSVLRSLVLDPDGNEDFTRVGTPFTGIPEAVDRLMQRLAAAFDMPVTELFGISPAGLNATGQSDREHWYDTIATDQENELAPRLKRVYHLVALAKNGPLKGKDINFKIKFNPLHSPTEDDIASTRLKNAQRDQIYLETSALTPEEVAVTLQDIYPHLDVESREEQIKAGKQFDPYGNEPPPDPTGGAGTAGGIGEGQSPTVPLPGSSIHPGAATGSSGNAVAPAGEGQGTPGDAGSGNPRLGKLAKTTGRPRKDQPATGNAGDVQAGRGPGETGGTPAGTAKAIVQLHTKSLAALAKAGNAPPTPPKPEERKKDSDDVAAATTLALLRAQLEADFPPENRAWIGRVPWEGPLYIDPSRINYESEGVDKALQQPEMIAQFERDITGGLEKPVIVVKQPNNSMLKIIDGHHHALAYRNLGKPVLAFIGDVPSVHGPWDMLEDFQAEGKFPQTTLETDRLDGQPHIIIHHTTEGTTALAIKPSKRAALSHAKSLMDASGGDARVLSVADYATIQRSGWDPGKHPKHPKTGRFHTPHDQQVPLPLPKADAIPVREQPDDFGTVVPREGSHCANCTFLASGDPPLCGNATFAEWVQLRQGLGSGTAPAPIPAPGGDIDRYCCSAWQGDPDLAVRESKADLGADHAALPVLTPTPSPEAAKLPDASIGILRDGNRVLAVRAAEGWRGHSWALPGGTAEPNETPEMTLRRELAEETGAVCINVEPALDIISPTDGRTVHVFHVRQWAGELRPDFLEIRKLRWLMPVQLLHASGPWRKSVQELMVKGVLGGKAETETGPGAAAARLVEYAAQASGLAPTATAPLNSHESDDNPMYAEYGKIPTRMDSWPAADRAAYTALPLLLATRADGAQAGAVFRQLLDDYPASALGWVLAGHWSDPIPVPADDVDFSKEDSWTASKDGKLDQYVQKIQEGKLKPVILVKPPNDQKYIIVDGHHRSLAYRELGRPILAYCAEVHVPNGPWLKLHGMQKRGRSGPGSTSAPSWKEANAIADDMVASIPDAYPTISDPHSEPTDDDLAGHPKGKDREDPAEKTDGTWNEGDHPRGPDGKFGAGGPLSAKNTPFGNLGKPAAWTPPEERPPVLNDAYDHFHTKQEWTSAIGRYGGSAGFFMNGIMKYGLEGAQKKYGLTDMRRYEPDIQHLKDAMKDAPKSPGSVIRGAGIKDMSEFKEGATFTNKCFWSTSAKTDIGASFAKSAKKDFPDKTPVVFHIEQKSGADVSRLTGFDNEKEVLMPPDCRMQVTHIEKPDSDAVYSAGRYPNADPTSRQFTNIWVKEL